MDADAARRGSGLGRRDEVGEEGVGVVGEADVGVEEEEQVARGGGGPGVAPGRDRLPLRAGVHHDAVGEALGDGERAVRRAAIGHDDVEPEAAAALRRERLQERPEPLDLVERRDDDADARRRNAAATHRAEPRRGRDGFL